MPTRVALIVVRWPVVAEAMNCTVGTWVMFAPTAVASRKTGAPTVVVVLLLFGLTSWVLGAGMAVTFNVTTGVETAVLPESSVATT